MQKNNINMKKEYLIKLYSKADPIAKELIEALDDETIERMYAIGERRFSYPSYSN